MGQDGRQAGRVKVKSFDRRSGPAVGLTGTAFVLGGLAAAGLGVAVTAVPGAHPLLSQASWILGRLGLAGVHLLVPGAALVAGGAVLFALRSFSKLIGVDRETAEAVDDLTRATTGQADAIEKLESLVAVLRQEIAEAGVVLRDQAAILKQKEENDPLFRLAASLDQLGQRIDRNIQSARDFVAAEVHSLHDFVEQAPSFDATPLVDSAVRVERGLIEFGERVDALERALSEALRPLTDMPNLAPLTEAVDEPREAYVGGVAGDLRDDAYGRYDGDGGHDERDLVESEAQAFAEEPTSGPEHDEPLRLVPLAEAWEPAWAPGSPRAAEAPRSAALAREPFSGEVEPPAPLPSPRVPVDLDEPATELSIEVELDRAFVDASEDEVPAPLPAERPQGLDLLARLDSAHPLQVSARHEAPPLFPDLDLEHD